MSIDALQTIVIPPNHPTEVVLPEQWRLFEHVTGVSFPPDYKQYLNCYGTGIIGGVIVPFNPFCQRPILKAYYTLRDWSLEALAIRTIQHRYGMQEFPYPLYPESGGVLPWGSTDNGDRLYWLTVGPPEEWTILINEVRSSTFENFLCSMSSFVVGIITGALHSEIIPHSCIDNDFVPM